MISKAKIQRLIEQEKLLYLEVEQLRYSLYLHNGSIIFEIVSVFYFTGLDIKKLFFRDTVQKRSLYEVKKIAIASLLHKKNSLVLLSKTPYAWLINNGRRLVNRLSSQSALKEDKSQKNNLYLVFGTTNATDLQARSVQIARRIAEKYRVVYIEGIFDQAKKPGFRIIEESKNFTAVRLPLNRAIHLNYQKPSPKEIAMLTYSFKLFLSYFTTLKLYNFTTYYIHHPFWSFTILHKKNSYIFDHANDFTHLHNAEKHIVFAEKKLLKNARVLTAPDTSLLRNNKDILIKNGVDWSVFKDTSKMIQTCDVGLCWIKKPVMGFIGTLDEKIDEVLLAKLAKAFPTASVVLVGNTDYRPVIEVAEQNKNIFPVGKQPYLKLPLFLQSFDILIIPYKQFSKGIAIHPELPLYLASGKPIVATQATAAVAKGALYQPKSHIEWTDAVAEALKEKRRSKKRSLRTALAKKLIWNVNILLKNM